MRHMAATGDKTEIESRTSAGVWRRRPATLLMAILSQDCYYRPLRDLAMLTLLSGISDEEVA